MNKMIIPQYFYLLEDVTTIAKKLLGKKLCTEINNQYTSGFIVETEAYKAPNDSASHAFKNRITPRNKVMYQEGGTIYVYLIYGIHHLFNIITNSKGIPHAVLIRAIEPNEGKDIMLKRRKLPTYCYTLSNGPGLLTQALGINIQHTGLSIMQKPIWIEEGITINKKSINSSPRIGLGKNVLEPYKSIPWRFTIKNNLWVSQ